MSIIKHKFTIIKGGIASGKTTLAGKLYNVILETENSNRKEGLLLAKNYHHKQNIRRLLKVNNIRDSKIMTYDEFMQKYFYKHREYRNKDKFKIINEEIKLYLINKLVDDKKNKKNRFLNLIMSSKELAYKIYKIYKFTEDNYYEKKEVKDDFYRKFIGGLTDENINDIKDILKEYNFILSKNNLADYSIIAKYYNDDILKDSDFIKYMNKFKFIILDDYDKNNYYVNNFMNKFYQLGVQIVAFCNEEDDEFSIEEFINRTFIKDKRELKVLTLKKCKVLTGDKLISLKKIKLALRSDSNIKIDYPQIQFNEKNLYNRDYISILKYIQKVIDIDEDKKDITIITDSKNLNYSLKRHIYEISNKKSDITINKINKSIVYNLNKDMVNVKDSIDNEKKLGYIYINDRINLMENSYFRNIITYCFMCKKIHSIKIEGKDISYLLEVHLNIKYSQAKILTKNYLNPSKYDMKFLRIYLSDDIINQYTEFKLKVEEVQNKDLPIDKIIFESINDVLGIPKDKMDERIVAKILSCCYDFIKVNFFSEKNSINDDLINFFIDTLFYVEGTDEIVNRKHTTIRVMSLTEYQKRSIISDYIIIDNINVKDNLQYLNDVFSNGECNLNYINTKFIMSFIMRCKKKLFINEYNLDKHSLDIFRNLKKIIQ